MGISAAKQATTVPREEARRQALAQISSLRKSRVAFAALCKDLFERVSEDGGVSRAGLRMLTRLVVDGCHAIDPAALQELLDVLAPLEGESTPSSNGCTEACASDRGPRLGPEGFECYAHCVLRIVDAALRAEEEQAGTDEDVRPLDCSSREAKQVRTAFSGALRPAEGKQKEEGLGLWPRTEESLGAASSVAGTELEASFSCMPLVSVETGSEGEQPPFQSPSEATLEEQCGVTPVQPLPLVALAERAMVNASHQRPSPLQSVYRGPIQQFSSCVHGPGTSSSFGSVAQPATNAAGGSQPGSRRKSPSRPALQRPAWENAGGVADYCTDLDEATPSWTPTPQVRTRAPPGSSGRSLSPGVRARGRGGDSQGGNVAAPGAASANAPATVHIHNRQAVTPPPTRMLDQTLSAREGLSTFGSAVAPSRAAAPLTSTAGVRVLPPSGSGVASRTPAAALRSLSPPRSRQSLLDSQHGGTHSMHSLTALLRAPPTGAPVGKEEKSLSRGVWPTTTLVRPMSCWGTSVACAAGSAGSATPRSAAGPVWQQQQLAGMAAGGAAGGTPPLPVSWASTVPAPATLVTAEGSAGTTPPCGGANREVTASLRGSAAKGGSRTPDFHRALGRRRPATSVLTGAGHSRSFQMFPGDAT